jgi:hypothetical protein
MTDDDPYAGAPLRAQARQASFLHPTLFGPNLLVILLGVALLSLPHQLPLRIIDLVLDYPVQDRTTLPRYCVPPARLAFRWLAPAW